MKEGRNTFFILVFFFYSQLFAGCREIFLFVGDQNCNMKIVGGGGGKKGIQDE